MRTIAIFAVLAATLAVTPAAFGGSGGVTGPAFYVDGALYRTVNTPTDLSETGAPAHAWDTIYDFGGAQPNVATAAPGDRDYNGGRWMVRPGCLPIPGARASGQLGLMCTGIATRRVCTPWSMRSTSTPSLGRTTLMPCSCSTSVGISR